MPSTSISPSSRPIIQHTIRSIVHRVEMSLLLHQQQLQHIDAESADDVHMPMPIVQVTIVGHSIGLSAVADVL
jgi:hypothetical protein